MREYFPNVTLKMHDRAYYVFFVKLELLHMIEKTCLKLRSLAQNPDEVSALEKKYLALVDRHDYVAMLYWIGMRFTWAAKRIRRKKELPAVRIGIVGGEHILSELDSIMAKIKGIAERGIYLEWRSGFRFMARAFGSEPALKGNESLFYMKSLSKDYLHPAAMTSEIFSCAHALEFAEEGFDGILHVYAMGCMPQTALKPVLHKIAKDKHVPILALPLRDQFNEAGIETRLDAFIDLVEQNSINHTGGV